MLVSRKMSIGHLIAAVAPTAERTARHWLYQLGGIGLIPLALLDNSPIPLPGSVDVLTILLSAREQQWWLYYGLMATAGSVLGGFVTYRIARRGGKAALERKFPVRKVEKVYKIFRRWGFGAVAIPALLPPPMPMTPFLFAAGAMQYPAGKFLAALTLGRLTRYLTLAYLAARYGRQIIAFIVEYGHPTALTILGVLLVVACVATYFLLGGKRKKRQRK
jgi:membrane protein YqaA with SNARE-associated domain